MSDPPWMGIGYIYHKEPVIIAGRLEPIVDFGGSVSPSSAGYGAPIAIASYHFACSGLGFAAMDGAVTADAVEIARVNYNTSRQFLWCYYKKNYSPYDYNSPPVATGSSQQGGGCDTILFGVDPLTPVATVIPGSTGTTTCSSTSFVTTGPNQRVFILVGMSGPGVPTPPTGYRLASTVGGMSFGVTNSRAQLYASDLGAFPNAGMTVPSVTFSSPSSGYMNCATIIFNGHEVLPSETVIVSSRVQMAGGNPHSDMVLPGAKKGDIWCSFGTFDLSTDAATYTFPEYDTSIGGMRFGYPNEEHFGLDCDNAVGFVETLNINGQNISLHLLLRNVRKAYPIRNWNSTTNSSPTGTFPTYTIPAGPTPAADGVGVDIFRWLDGHMYVANDAGTVTSGQRGTGDINRIGASGLIHAIPVISGVPKSSRVITTAGSSVVAQPGRSVVIIGQDNSSSIPLRRAPRPRYVTNASFSPSTTLPMSWTSVVGEVQYACMASNSAVVSVSSGWTYVGQYDVAPTHLYVVKKVATSTSESVTFTTAASADAWGIVMGIKACDSSAEAFVKTNRSPGSGLPFIHAFNFSDVLEPTVSICFVAVANSFLTFQPGPRMPKTATNKVWSGPYWGGSWMPNMNTIYGTALIDGTVTDVSQSLEWSCILSGGGTPVLAICIGLLGSLY